MVADEKFSVVVLAGGQGRRLGGINKASLVVEGRRLIDRVLAAVRPLSDDILIVGHLVTDLDDPAIRLVPDELPYRSSLTGVYTGLLHARRQLAVVVACDMPYLSTAALAWVAKSAQGCDVAVPQIGGHYEALHAAYRRSCLPVMKTALEQGRFKLIDIYPALQLRVIEERELRSFDPDLRSLINVNNPADLEKVQAPSTAAGS